MFGQFPYRFPSNAVFRFRDQRLATQQFLLLLLLVGIYHCYQLIVIKQNGEQNAPLPIFESVPSSSEFLNHLLVIRSDVVSSPMRRWHFDLPSQHDGRV